MLLKDKHFFLEAKGNLTRTLRVINALVSGSWFPAKQRLGIRIVVATSGRDEPVGSG